MALHVARRTERTALIVDENIGESTGVYSVGQMNVGYSTPQYLLNYGIVNGPSDTQLSSGSFNRGVTLGLPRGQNEIDLIAARTIGTSGESFRVGAIRHTRAYAKGLLFNQTFYLARGDQSGARNTTLDLSLGRYKSGQTLRSEIAFSNSRGIAGISDGTRFAYAVHGDFFGSKTSTSVGYFRIPQGYITLGQTLDSQNNFQFTHRRPVFKAGILTFDYGDQTTYTDGLASRATHDTFNLSLPLGKAVNSQTLVNFVRNSSGSLTTFERDAGLTLSEQISGFNFGEVFQGSRIESDSGSSAAQTQYAFTAAHRLFGGFASVQTVKSHTFGDDARDNQSETNLAFVREIGRKAEVSFGFDRTRLTSMSGGIGTTTDQSTTTYSLLRRFSPVVGLRMTYARTRQSGVAGGAANTFNVDLIGPLAIGTAARYGGRINPNLPAVVQGHVYLQTEASSYGLVGNRGIPNVLVTLDGGLTQRTDASGGFEFRFVKPGSHIITISSGTLPIGVIPDTATQSFTVQGGQIVNVDFAAGLFAGVTGKVMVQKGTGAEPVPGVLLIVDGKQRGYTGPDGIYQIGHLSPGSHSVAIETDALPTSMSVSGAASKDVQVSQGQLSSLDWTLTGLGSIRGSVLFTADSGFGDLVGAKDVYVVADPGQHASITDGDGNFVIDNLPVGEYTLSVDQDSLPDGQSVIQGPEGPVSVTGDEAVNGILFKVGPAAKQVVFTFSGGSAAALTANFEPDQAPQNATVDLVVTTQEKQVKSVVASSDVFGNFALHYSPARKAWIARVHVPALQNGDYAVHVTLNGAKTGTADASITVSNALQLIVAHGVPSHPLPGQSVRVIARILGPVDPGDLVVFEDRQQTKLPIPKGRLYVFTVRPPHGLPYRGIIFTKTGERLPFVIQP